MRQIEESCVVNWFWEIRGVEVIELHLGANKECVALLARCNEVSTKHVSRVARERIAIEVLDVAEHARGRVDLAAPGQDLEGAGVWVSQNIGFVGTGQTFNCRTIDTDTFSESTFDLGRCHSN